MVSTALVLASFLAWAALAQASDRDTERPALQGLKLLDRDSDGPIALMTTGASIVPAQNLLVLERPGEVRIAVISGSALLLYRASAREDPKYLTEVSYRAQRVRLPRILVGKATSESFLSIEVDGEAVVDPIRIFNQIPSIFGLY